MKASASKYKIISRDLGKTWRIEPLPKPGEGIGAQEPVKICKSYKAARTWHHALTYGLRYAQSAKATN